MKSKRAVDGMMWMLAIIVLFLLFLFIYSGVWTKLFGKGVSGIDDQIDSASDNDNDGIANFIDKCPCDPGTIENNGCKSDHKITGDESRSCLQK